jgi:hypothetical protein
MAEERKSILLRIPPTLWEEITRLAERDLRSTNAQIEFLLREAIRQRGGKPGIPDAGGTDTQTGAGTDANE